MLFDPYSSISLSSLHAHYYIRYAIKPLHICAITTNNLCFSTLYPLHLFSLKPSIFATCTQCITSLQSLYQTHQHCHSDHTLPPLSHRTFYMIYYKSIYNSIMYYGYLYFSLYQLCIDSFHCPLILTLSKKN